MLASLQPVRLPKTRIIRKKKVPLLSSSRSIIALLQRKRSTTCCTVARTMFGQERHGLLPITLEMILFLREMVRTGMHRQSTRRHARRQSAS
ncbi:hypothetical protein JG687_00018229 [Phytophthora cactorum]|uniref:Uncharacterized protein n=1 Tax=Phytophthora cactorum TaxID=29920 RepID=A0A8T1TQ20_9STRA|nr:hypothetical protein JG687_00018229 [Phytophthora cactorum]